MVWNPRDRRKVISERALQRKKLGLLNLLHPGLQDIAPTPPNLYSDYYPEAIASDVIWDIDPDRWERTATEQLDLAYDPWKIYSTPFFPMSPELAHKGIVVKDDVPGGSFRTEARDWGQVDKPGQYYGDAKSPTFRGEGSIIESTKPEPIMRGITIPTDKPEPTNTVPIRGRNDPEGKQWPQHRAAPTSEKLTMPKTYPNTGPPGWKPKAAGVATKKKGPTAEERAEAWKLAMEDAQGFMGPMQGGTIPGVAPGGGSQDHKMSVYGTGGYDLASNRPIADTDAVRKRLYGIMGFV
jgi:hypothetical protein